MLRNDAYWFLRLGGAIERADNTARILDVKYHLLLPEREQVGGGLDYFQWTTILREVSALTAYHWVYRDSVKPWLVADLLILNRADAALAGQLLRGDRALPRPARRRLWPARPEPAAGRRDRWRGSARRGSRRSSSPGLHEFITGFLADNTAVAAAIAEQYLVLRRGCVAHPRRPRDHLRATSAPAQGDRAGAAPDAARHEGQHVARWRIDTDVDVRLRAGRGRASATSSTCLHAEAPVAGLTHPGHRRGRDQRHRRAWCAAPSSGLPPRSSCATRR